MLLICAFLLMLPTSEFLVLQVCRKGWMLAVGGTEKMHRTVLSCVLRGHGPGDAAAEVSMKKMLRNVEAVLDASGTRDNEKRGYAAHWWKNYLLLCDWLPNEERIQIRGPSYDFLHKHVYGEAAKQAGKNLSYKTWMGCKAEGLVLVAALLKGSDPKRLRASRSARHSKCVTHRFELCEHTLITHRSRGVGSVYAAPCHLDA